MSAFGDTKGDPVAFDQGGRMMEFDPAGSTEENAGELMSFTNSEARRMGLPIPIGWQPKLRCWGSGVPGS